MSLIGRALGYYRRDGLQGVLAKLARNPGKVGAIFNESDFYGLELPVFAEDVVTFVRSLVETDDEDILTVWSELRDSGFQTDISKRLRMTNQRPDDLHSNWRELLYVLIRMHEPDTVVETGIHDGLSSAYILAALERNGTGELISIDVNDVARMPTDIADTEAGWVVPDKFRDRWDRRFGDARELLPEVAADRTIDCFLHDSLHTPEHMQFEYQTAVEAMPDGALLVSDNTRLNDVFWSFAQENLRKLAFWKNTSHSFTPDNKQVDDRLGAGIVNR